MKFLKIRDEFYINTNNIIQITQYGNDHIEIEYQAGQGTLSVSIFDIKIEELITKINYDNIHSYLYDIKNSIQSLNITIAKK